ncbi:uncharacterized protein LOC108916715 isoform X2 [Anoplophora glabripennis]|uniref:uncharacterized protein LOC108916715 isoform X2 n=1 Tax=Anoplophora glabripennis TaxID=217634 RepID=UPI0008752AB7|nr:uncharacterized protein LOC108916715 isoform X2 [Anoplophora glabripennis]
MRTTGGGPPMDVKWTETENSIKEILGSRMESFPSEFDYDCSNDATQNNTGNEPATYFNGDDSQISMSLENPIITVVDHDYVIDTSGAENGNMSHSRSSGVESKIDESECGVAEQNWGKYTPTMLRSKAHLILEILQNIKVLKISLKKLVNGQMQNVPLKVLKTSKMKQNMH